MRATLVNVLAAAGLGSAQMTAMNQMTNCVSTTSTVPCVVEYRPFMAPQIPPISTVYKSMMTTYLNVSPRSSSMNEADIFRSLTASGVESLKSTTILLQL